MQETSFEHTGADGVPLHVHRWAPEGEPRGIVQISHGMAEHSARYRRLAEALTGAGFLVYAHDHRGHGKSILPRAPVGHMASRHAWRKTVDDLHGLNRRVAAENPGLPIVLLGHSMGSFMAQQLLFEQPGDMVACVLSGTNGKPPPIAAAGRVVTRIERARLGRKRTSGLVQQLSFGEYNRAFKPARTEFDWLSRDPAEVDKYVSDPLCGFAISVQSWIDLLDALDYLSRLDNIRRIPRQMPIYVFGGTKDPVGENGRGPRRLVDAYRDAGLTDVSLRLYTEGRHEMLNEVNREEVVTDLLAFLDRVVPKKAA